MLTDNDDKDLDVDKRQTIYLIRGLGKVSIANDDKD